LGSTPALVACPMPAVFLEQFRYLASQEAVVIGHFAR
jgi:hypothetical protein